MITELTKALSAELEPGKSRISGKPVYAVRITQPQFETMVFWETAKEAAYLCWLNDEKNPDFGGGRFLIAPPESIKLNKNEPILEVIWFGDGEGSENGLSCMIPLSRVGLKFGQVAVELAQEVTTAKDKKEKTVERRGENGKLTIRYLGTAGEMLREAIKKRAELAEIAMA